MWIETNKYRVLSTVYEEGDDRFINLLDDKGDVVAEIRYISETRQFMIIQNAPLPAHFVEGFINQARSIIKPYEASLDIQWFIFNHYDRCSLSTNIPSDNSKGVGMDENLFLVLEPWLRWIPTVEVYTQKQSMGFERYSLVRLKHENASSFLKMIVGFQKIIEQGPNQIQLPGDWHYPWVESEDGNELFYREEFYPGHLPFSKEEALNTLSGLIGLAERVIEGGSDFYILQVGI